MDEFLCHYLYLRKRILNLRAHTIDPMHQRLMVGDYRISSELEGEDEEGDGDGSLEVVGL